MNARYLLRAKRKNWRELPKEKWWVEGYYAYMKPYHYIMPKDNFDSWIEIDVKTLCQRTGKRDEEKKLIFEHDIVGFLDCTSTENGYSEKGCVGEVLWDDETSSFQVTGRLSAESYEVLGECKVLGNIFDNQELLEIE